MKLRHRLTAQSHTAPANITTKKAMITPSCSLWWHVSFCPPFSTDPDFLAAQAPCPSP